MSEGMSCLCQSSITLAEHHHTHASVVDHSTVGTVVMASEQPQETPPAAYVAMGEAVPASAELAAPLAGSSTDDIRRQVEQEQALADTQRRLSDLQAELESVKKEKRALETERQASCEQSWRTRQTYAH